MQRRTQTTSKEDSSTTADLHIETAEQAFHAAVTYAKDMDQEWLVGLCLSPERCVKDGHVVFRSPTCQPCPGEAVDALVHAAACCHPDALVVVRYHVDPWCGPRTRGMRRFQAFRRQLEAKGLYLQETYVADRTGEVYPLLGEPVSAPMMQLSAYASGVLWYIGGISDLLGGMF